MADLHVALEFITRFNNTAITEKHTKVHQVATRNFGAALQKRLEEMHWEGKEKKKEPER
jgi:hypothetical protein